VVGTDTFRGVFNSEGTVPLEGEVAPAVWLREDHVFECAPLPEIVSVCWPDGRAVLRLVGDVDSSTAHRVFAAVVDLDLRTGADVAIDVAGVKSVDCVGASVLVACETVAREHACTFGVISPSPQARSGLTSMGLNRLLPVPDQVDALRPIRATR
jgi:anti-anti-sigma factor